MSEEKPLSRQRKYQLLQTENGLCRNCPKKTKGTVYCDACRAKNKERYSATHKPKWRCRHCGIKGHNTRTCPDFKKTKDGKAKARHRRRLKAELEYWSKDY